MYNQKSRYFTSSKAAALRFGLIQKRPFIDGNKRIGVHLCDMVDRIKADYTDDDDLVQLGLPVADRRPLEKPPTFWPRLNDTKSGDPFRGEYNICWASCPDFSEKSM